MYLQISVRTLFFSLTFCAMQHIIDKYFKDAAVRRVPKYRKLAL
jgi:hypothetical protein